MPCSRLVVLERSCSFLRRDRASPETRGGSQCRTKAPSTNEFEGRQRKQLTRRGLLATARRWPGRRVRARAARASGAGARRVQSGARPGTVTLGSYETDPGIKALAAAIEEIHRRTRASSVKTNTVDHNTFQNQINSYLQGNPDDVFTWFAGYRMQFFAAKGLATPIDDVWKALTPQMPPSIKAASTGLDGHQYLVPNKNYPWAVYYRKSLWKEKGYKVPDDVGPVHRPRQEDADRRASRRSPSPTRTAGRRWARSTSSTCASTATSSTST